MCFSSSQMEVSGFVISAGRAVLDMVEREWQPLSADELDQRLDHAVEEILETELITQLKSQSTSPPTPPAAPVYVHLLQSQHNVEPQVLQTAAAVCGSPVHEEETADSGNSAAVKVMDSGSGAKYHHYYHVVHRKNSILYVLYIAMRYD